jgi:hypothetical protein
MHEDGFLSFKRAASWADVSPRTLSRWVAQGLPVYQASARSKLLFRTTDIESFLTKRRAIKPHLDELVEQVARSLSKPSEFSDCRFTGRR